MSGTQVVVGPARARDAVEVVARREIAVKLRDKAFIGSTVFMLLLVTAATLIPMLLQQQVPSLRVAVHGQAAGETVELATLLGRDAQDPEAQPALAALLGGGGLPAADLAGVPVGSAEEAEQLVLAGEVAAAVIGDELGALRVTGAQGVPAEVDLLVRAASAQLQVARAADGAGLSAAQLQSLITPVPPLVEVLDAVPTGAVPPELLVILFAFLFYLAVLTFGMSIAQSVVEEKQSRVVELLVAAIPVRWLLAGKVVGNTVMAVGQIVVILGAGLLGATIAGQGELVRQVGQASGWFVLFFLLGFVMLACLWAVGGSLASRVEELQATTVVMQVMVIVPFFAAIFAIEPGPVQRLLSYIPFTAPLVMPARVLLGVAEPWEPVVSAALVLVTAVAFVALGARLYEGSVLHTSARLRATTAWKAAR